MKTITSKIVCMFFEMAFIIAAIFVFYSVIIYQIFACQRRIKHLPLRSSWHISQTKCAGNTLRMCDGRASLVVTNAETIRTITSTNPVRFINALIVVHNLEPQRELYLRNQSSRFHLGSMLSDR